MGCLAYSVSPVYNSEFNAELSNDFAFSATCVNDALFAVTRIRDFLFGATPVFRLSFLCELVSEVPPFLEVIMPVYGPEFKAGSCNDFAFNVSRSGESQFTVTSSYDFLFGSASAYDMAFRCELVCSIPPYLEIEPDIIWLTDWSSENDVISNTLWNVN